MCIKLSGEILICFATSIVSFFFNFKLKFKIAISNNVKALFAWRRSMTIREIGNNVSENQFIDCGRKRFQRKNQNVKMARNNYTMIVFNNLDIN